MSQYLGYLLRSTFSTFCRRSIIPKKPSSFIISSAIKMHTVVPPTFNLVPSREVSSGYSPLLALSILGWLGFEKPTENIEDELIKNIKWGILLMQRKDYKKSERMFHLALRMAQQLQNQRAVTYIYDMMANLAMETDQHEKALKLFVSVMERLIGTGYPETHIKNIHISLKIARCYHLSGQHEKAGVGYRWVLDQLEKDRSDRLEPVTKLIAIAKDWYGHYLLEQHKLQEGLPLMLEAYNLLKQINDEDDNEEIICLVNDIGALYEKMGDLEMAEKYLKEAIRTTRKLSDDVILLSTLYINLGRIFLMKDLIDKAEKCCKKALNLARAGNSEECSKEAYNCLKEVKNIHKGK